jgi:putative tricarboxylic transport membrane protein
MDALSALIDGFRVALTPINLLWALAGVTLGTLVGVLPGIGPALTVALLLPVTFSLQPIEAFIMFAGIYYGGMYGGSTTAILLNTPGESASVMTAVEGHLMARAGRGGAALATAAIGSFVAGTLATAALTFSAPLMANAALRFGPAEYFALTMLAFVAVSSVLGESTLKGLASLFFGLVLGLIGIDPLTGEARMSFGIPELLDGIDVVIVAVGLFAVGESLFAASRVGGDVEDVIPLRGSLWMTREDWSRSWRPWLRGTALGFPAGVLPAGGSEIPTFLSYSLERRLAREPQRFGSGAIEGVAGPEAANNAAAAGTLVPLLTLGLPTSATAAILLAAFQQYGLQPGPLLFTRDVQLVWGLIASLYIGNTMLLVLNLPLVGLWVRLLEVPRPFLHAGILVLASVGAYSVNRSIFDVGLLYVVGGAGYLMRCWQIPLAPAVIGAILGPMAEQHLRRALAAAEGSWMVFVTRPIAATVLATAAAIALLPVVVRRWSGVDNRRRGCRSLEIFAPLHPARRLHRCNIQPSRDDASSTITREPGARTGLPWRLRGAAGHLRCRPRCGRHRDGLSRNPSA